MSYASVDDARLYDAQNPWGPGDDFYLGLVRAAGDVLDGPLADTSPEIVMVARRPFVGG